MQYSIRPPPRYGRSAIAAIIAAIGSVVLSCSGHWLAGLILACLAVPLGLLGFLRSASPEIRGGVMSIAAIGIAILGLIIAILALVFRIAVIPL